MKEIINVDLVISGNILAKKVVFDLPTYKRCENPKMVIHEAPYCVALRINMVVFATALLYSVLMNSDTISTLTFLSWI